MNNLDKITEPWKWGWSAVIKDSDGMEGHIVDYYMEKSGFMRIAVKHLKSSIGWHYAAEVKITGYLYAGELAGNEPIPEGQKFRVKETGEIWKMESEDKKTFVVFLSDPQGFTIGFNKSEIEPVFD